MDKDAKDRMCNNGIIKQNNLQTKNVNNSSNNTRKNSLKRTESKMDDNQNVSEDEPIYESEIEDPKWQYQGRSNKRGNKAPRTDSFVQGRIITSSRAHGRTDKYTNRHESPQEEERKNQKRNDNQQMSKLNDDQYDSTNDIQYIDTVNKQNKTLRYEKDAQQPGIQDPKQIYISRHALKFAVEDRFPSLKIKCDPILKDQNDASLIVKGLLNHIERNFRKLNPYFNNPLGFDHYLIDNNGDLVCLTKYIDLFVFLCDKNNYPETINNVKIYPTLPTKLPTRNAIILKFIDNKITFEDIQFFVKEKLKSVYAIEEMMGTFTYRSRHIRVDLLSKDEYTKVLNSGKFVINGHLYEVDEYLPSPKVLICSKCNVPGHVKKVCQSTIDVCKRCGEDKNDGKDHKECKIYCHHCGGEHEATSYKCPVITKYRQELLRQLKSNTHLLPPHVQLYIPQQYRDAKDKKFLVNKNSDNYQIQARHQNPIHMNLKDINVFPSLNSTTTASSSLTPIWNTELKKLHEELDNLKKEHDNELKQLKTENDNQMQKLIQGWQLINLQIKTQAEAISDIYSTVSETLPPIIKSMQIMSHIMKELNGNLTNDNDRHARESMLSTINDTINTYENRFILLKEHQQKLKSLMDKQNELLLRGFDSTIQLTNE